MKGRVKLYTQVNEPAPVRVLLPYVRASQRLQLVIDGLRIQQVQPELHQVDDSSGYWKLLRDTWAEGEEFFTVEHDVFVWQGGIRALAECDQDWCSLPTLCHGRLISTTLGCMKFGKRFVERRPGFFDDIAKTWFHLDAAIADKAGWPFIRPHIHLPPASHLNEIQWPDEVSTRYALERKIAWQAHEEGRAVARVQYRMSDGTEKVAAATVDREGSEGG